MQGNCWFFSCFGGTTAGTEEAELHELISHSAIEEVGVHGSGLLRLAKLLLILAHRLELLLIPLGDSGLSPQQQFPPSPSLLLQAEEHTPRGTRRSIPQEHPGREGMGEKTETPWASLTAREIASQLGALLASQVSPASPSSLLFLPGACSKASCSSTRLCPDISKPKTSPAAEEELNLLPQG